MSFFDRFSEIDFRKPATVFKIFAGSAFIIAVTFAAVYFYMDSITTVIPDMSQYNVFEVQQWIDDNNLTNEQVVVKKNYNEDVPVDQVVSQSLESGSSLGDQILIIDISKGKDPDLEIDLIDFTEMTETEIVSWFTENLFIDVSVEYEASTDVEKDKFIRVNAEGSAKRSDMIVITMSAGTKSEGIEVIMPDFTEYTKANIEAWANTNNIDISYKYAYSDDIESGKVLMQDPAADTTVLTGSSATVTISRGKAVIISDFIGNTESSITSWASENGIILRKYTVYSELDAGLVVSTNPKARTTITVGSTVQYEVSAGLITLENYVNRPKTEFTDYIEELNNEYNDSADITIQYKEDSSDTIDSGSVISMQFGSSEYDSASDTELMIEPGTTIVVTISTGKEVTVISKANTPEADFKEYCSDLGLNTKKTAEKYSSTIPDGNIISNDTGDFKENETVNYILSMGEFTPVMSEYENKTISSANSKLESYISQGASSSWKIVSGAYVDSPNASGNTVDCTSSGTTITCTISKGEAVSVGDHSGDTLAEFTSYLNANNLVLGTKTERYNDLAKGIIISNETGSKYAGESVYYTISKGEFVPAYGSYSNKTISEAQTALDSEVPDYLSGYSLSQTSTSYSDSVAENDIISCTYSNKTVSCQVSLGVEPETPTTFYLMDLIPEEDRYHDPQVTKSNIQSYLDEQGISQFFTINIISAPDNITSGSLIDYPAEGKYDMLSTDPKLIINIADYPNN